MGMGSGEIVGIGSFKGVSYKTPIIPRHATAVNIVFTPVGEGQPFEDQFNEALEHHPDHPLAPGISRRAQGRRPSGNQRFVQKIMRGLK